MIFARVAAALIFMVGCAQAQTTTFSSTSPDLIVTKVTGGYTIGAAMTLADQSGKGGAIATGAAETTVKIGNFPYTIAAAGSSGFGKGWSATLLNVATGSGSATITTTGSIFEGASGDNILSLPPGYRATLIADGANWLTLVGGQPLPALSPDGTKSSAPSGPTLINASGGWSWGAAYPSRPGEYWINLNGVGTGIGLLMEVADGGQMFVNTTSSGWWVWNQATANWQSSMGP